MFRPIQVQLVAALVLLGSGCAGAQDSSRTGGREPIVGKPCEGCEAIFEGLSEELSSTARIAPKDEPGEPMRIEGTVYDPEGQPAPGVIVYAYHTDAHGIYPKDERMKGKAAHRHGRLRAWAKTDEKGRYLFETIRPASYPDSTVPAHVHMHILEPGRCTYYIDDLRFSDDPFLTRQEREDKEDGRGGSGLVEPRRNEEGERVVTRDIHLGQNVPGYPEWSG